MSEEKKSEKAERRLLGGFKKSSLVLPPESTEDWPLNLRELLEWHTEEVMAVSKEAELRIKQISQIVADCADGKTSLAEAANLKHEYEHRWGETLNGVYEAHLKSDAQILEEIDLRRSGKWLEYVRKEHPTKGRGKGREPGES